jgi:hypothetical protein
MHRLDEAQLVRDLGRMRQQVADPCARIAVLLKLENGGRRRETGLRRRHSGETLTATDGVRQFGSSEVMQARLVIEKIEL